MWNRIRYVSTKVETMSYFKICAFVLTIMIKCLKKSNVQECSTMHFERTASFRGSLLMIHGWYYCGSVPLNYNTTTVYMLGI